MSRYINSLIIFINFCDFITFIIKKPNNYKEETLEDISSKSGKSLSEIANGNPKLVVKEDQVVRY